MSRVGCLSPGVIVASGLIPIEYGQEQGLWGRVVRDRNPSPGEAEPVGLLLSVKAFWVTE